MVAAQQAKPPRNATVQFQDLGLIDYKQGWDYQDGIFQATVKQKIANRKLPEGQQKQTTNTLLFCEHPPVYTLGKNGQEANLLLTPEQLHHKNIQYFPTNRGGDITFHGPGQIVGYPIFDLEHFFTDIHRYLRVLEEAIIQTLNTFGIQAGRYEGLTGVWLYNQDQTNARKICAMGVRASRWVTMHGFALNVNTDLAYFGHIVPCGISDKAVTSMQHELGQQVPMAEVKEELLKQLSIQFEMTLTTQ